MFSPEVEELEEVIVEDLDLFDRGLVVLNDDFNTFDHVIDTLIKVCRHDRIQAEQCTHIIHHKGKCEVKKGSLEILRPMKEGILDKGISAVIV